MLCDNISLIGVILMSTEKTQKEEIQTIPHFLKDIENRLSLNIADRLNNTIKWQVGISLSLISTVIISLVGVFIYMNKITDDIQSIKTSFIFFKEEIKEEIKGVKEEIKEIKEEIAKIQRVPASLPSNELKKP